MIARAKPQRRLRRPPPDVATVRFVPLALSRPGEPKGLAEMRAERAVLALVELGTAKAAP